MYLCVYVFERERERDREGEEKNGVPGKSKRIFF